MPGFSSVGRACDCSRLANLPPLLKGGCGYHNVSGSNPPTRNKYYYYVLEIIIYIKYARSCCFLTTRHQI